VDIASKEVLPIWVPQDAIGGRSIFGSERRQSDASASTLAKLGRALQAATSQHKMFRSFSQWVGAFLKYAAVATALKQLTTARVFSYMNVISQIYDEERNGQGLCIVAILYDDVFRKTIAMRAEARDPELNMDEVFTRVEKSISESCKARVESVARATLGTSRPSESSGSQPTQETHLAKQTAAAEAAAHKAEKATKMLEEAKKALEDATQHGVQKNFHKRKAWQANQMANQFERQSKGKFQKGKGKGKPRY